MTDESVVAPLAACWEALTFFAAFGDSMADATYYMYDKRPYNMQKRTTILLDDEVQAAARELAHRYGCSTSEAIRRSVLHHRETVMGVSPARRKERVQVLNRLIELFEDHDVEEEIRRLKEQDEGF